MPAVFKKTKNLKGEIVIPGDKSISHRSVMLGALSKGTTEVTHFLNAADCNSTIRCFNNMPARRRHVAILSSIGGLIIIIISIINSTTAHIRSSVTS